VRPRIFALEQGRRRETQTLAVEMAMEPKILAGAAESDAGR
jgi:hypothetical protein